MIATQSHDRLHCVIASVILAKLIPLGFEDAIAAEGPAPGSVTTLAQRNLKSNCNLQNLYFPQKQKVACNHLITML